MVMDMKGRTKDNMKARMEYLSFVTVRIWSWFMMGHGSQSPYTTSP
jgi:hypothetical protein